MRDRMIFASALGDPMDPKTWSGTPHKILEEFKKLNVTVTTISTKLNRAQNLYCRLRTLASGAGYEAGPRSKVRRTLCTNKLKKTLSDLSIYEGNILYFDHFQAPPFPEGEFVNYLYTDSTRRTFENNLEKISEKENRNIDAIDREAFNGYKHIFTTSEFAKQSFVKDYQVNPTKISVVGTGRGGLQMFRGQKKLNNKQILFVAKHRFVEKGGDLILNGFLRARSSIPDVTLIIAGNDDYLKKYQNIDGVKVYGHISFSVLQNLFDESTLFAMPARHEPWGLVYLEAMACKMPIIGLRRGAFPEICDYGKYGAILDDESEVGMSKLLIDVFSDCQKMSSMGENAQKYVMEKFSWDITSKKIFNVIYGN